MLPQFEIFGYTIGSYGFTAAVAAIICGLLFLYMLKKHGLMIEDGILFLMIAMAGIFIGSHLLYAITNIRFIPKLFETNSFEEWLGIVTFIFGGAVFYGGLFGGIFAGRIAIKVLGLNGNTYSDMMTPIIPLFHGIARVGCFLAGCCYGIESEFGFYIDGNEFIPSLNGVVRFPVQLLESVCNLILSIVLFIVLKKSKGDSRFSGKLIYIYLISYGIIRFFDEFLRGDEIRGFVGCFSTSQWISIISIAASAFLLFKGLKKHKESAN